MSSLLQHSDAMGPGDRNGIIKDAISLERKMGKVLPESFLWLCPKIVTVKSHHNSCNEHERKGSGHARSANR